MIRHNISQKCETSIKQPSIIEGESIESKMERILNNREPITDGAPILYTERGMGVLANSDVRTDRFDVAIEAMDKISKTKLALREERHKKSDKKPETGTESIQGTEPTKPAA